MIDLVLINELSRASDPIFGKPLLERLVLACNRAGAKRFVIRAAHGERAHLLALLGRLSGCAPVLMVESFEELLGAEVETGAPCLMLSGNLVLSAAHLKAIIARHERERKAVTKLVAADQSRRGSVAIGPVEAVLKTLVCPDGAAKVKVPFILDGRREDLKEAELGLASALRHDTRERDALMARIFDRHLSWHLSLRLARTRITANQVTLANTLLGLICAWMFSVPSYGWRLAASLLFVGSVMIDGVDGEVARLKMTESAAGRLLDQVTDNIVHVAVFIGIMWGCHRTSGSITYCYLIPIQLGGFGLCAVMVNRALSLEVEGAAEFIARVDRFAGRDFAYLLVVLAMINHLRFFCWGTAVGTYIVTIALCWSTHRICARAQS